MRLAALRQKNVRVQRRIDLLKQVSDRFTWARVISFVMGLVCTILAFFAVGAWLFWIVLALSVTVFLAIVHQHRKIERAQVQYRLMRDFTAEQLARAHVDWDGLPRTRLENARYDHPFEGDLDIVGDHSLHHLLDTTVSADGCGRLREWLSATLPDADVIARRQALIAELRPRALFRLRLRLNAAAVDTEERQWQPQDLLNWLQNHQPVTSMLPRLLLLAALAALNLVALATSFLGLTEPWWYYTFLLYFGVYMALSRPARTVFHEATALQAAVEQLAGVVGYLERFQYGDAPRLRTLCAPFLKEGARPSQQLLRVKQVAAATGIQGNPIIWFLLNAVVPWDYFFAYQLNRYKAEVVHVAPGWQDIWAELEALSALANLAYLNPGYVVPEIAAIQNSESPVYVAQEMGHPLLPDDQKICNDFHFDALGQVAVLTGSNMAGKSTFLKTIGVNLSLAYAGGPVNAMSLQTDLFRLFTCIKVSDSVTDGISYFYAEVKRLKALLASLEEPDGLPLLFCIDEIFRGTNNRERLEGSRAYIRALVNKNGVGLISTHDLDLIKLADEMESVRNCHFRDAIEDGRMVFDYRLRPGPCPTTNALRIMRLEGLPVPDETTQSGS